MSTRYRSCGILCKCELRFVIQLLVIVVLYHVFALPMCSSTLYSRVQSKFLFLMQFLKPKLWTMHPSEYEIVDNAQVEFGLTDSCTDISYSSLHNIIIIISLSVIPIFY